MFISLQLIALCTSLESAGIKNRPIVFSGVRQDSGHIYSPWFWKGLIMLSLTL